MSCCCHPAATAWHPLHVWLRPLTSCDLLRLLPCSPHPQRAAARAAVAGRAAAGAGGDAANTAQGGWLAGWECRVGIAADGPFAPRCVRPPMHQPYCVICSPGPASLIKSADPGAGRPRGHHCQPVAGGLRGPAGPAALHAGKASCFLDACCGWSSVVCFAGAAGPAALDAVVPSCRLTCVPGRPVRALQAQNAGHALLVLLALARLLPCWPGSTPGDPHNLHYALCSARRTW